ncbi:hypothetical protein AU577_20470 [Salmonella enterica subsp. enterica serovar Alachua]|nr:hypothetical protein [Salmonella enterica subsp. enterica serovar Alachua]
MSNFEMSFDNDVTPEGLIEELGAIKTAICLLAAYSDGTCSANTSQVLKSTGKAKFIELAELIDATTNSINTLYPVQIPQTE